MRGDADDMVGRLRLTLPEGWIADDAPLLGAVLGGLGVAWAGLYGLLDRVRSESRLATVDGRFLDLACQDYFGGRLRRHTSEGDDSVRVRLAWGMRRARGTRAALIDAAAHCGYAATVFEPGRPADTGAYGIAASLAWGRAGGWGSIELPLQCFVTAHALAPTEALGPTLAEALPASGAAWVRVAG